jgi:hypothetical protein
MKNLLQILSLTLILGMFAFNSASAQCVELGTTVGELTPQLKSVGGVCGPAAVITNVCDCPTGFVAVGYEGLEGNQWGAQVLSQFSLRCKQLNQDGSLGASVVVTCSNGTDIGDNADGPIDAAAGEVLVGFEVRLGCAMDAVMGESKSILDIANGGTNTVSNAMMRIGGPGGSAQPITYAPDGNVIVGMQTYEDPSNNIAGGVAWRYASLTNVACSGNCSITSITMSNQSACDDGGTDNIVFDDTFTADITVNFSEAPASGTLNLSGNNGSIAVGSLVGNSHTFTGVSFASNGFNINVTASFSATPTCSLNASLGNAPDNCSPNAPAGGVPTLGQWGLILFGLIIFTMVAVFGTERKRTMALVNGSNVSTGKGSRMPFDRKIYMSVLPMVYLAIALIFAVAIFAFGYELTTADLPGSILSGAIVAYLVHFVKITSEKS